MLEEMKVKDLLELLKILNLNNTNSEIKKYDGEEIRIVILQRGWVMVGRFYQNGTECILKNSYIVRKWGATSGLGQIAEEGPTHETILDKNTEVKFHELTVVASLICNPEKWKDYVK